MKPKFLQDLALASSLFLALTGCQSAMSTPSTSSTPPDGSYSNANVEWPLKFKAHYFDAYCFSTYGCKVLYRNMVRVEDPDDTLKIASNSLANYPDILTAGMGPIPNFPSPVKVTWRSKDGTPHEADIDLGDIFKDQLIRHNVAREDATENATDGMPAIIVEVDDQTISVYMRATIWTKREQIPGNKYSHSREDLIKVFSRTY
jgi:hypothetical protein